MARDRNKTLEYVNIPKVQSAPSVSNEKQTLRLVLLSFGLLCVLQAALNVSLRVFRYEQQDLPQKNLTDQIVENFDEYFQDGWVLFNTSLYYMSNEERSWSESREHCVQREADLVVINSRYEQEFIRKFHRVIWLGLNHTCEGGWTWVDGTPLTTSFWAPNEPNDEREDCGEVRLFQTLNSWNDRNCGHQNYWLCEKIVL